MPIGETVSILRPTGVHFETRGVALEHRPAKRVEEPGGVIPHPLALAGQGLQPRDEHAPTGTFAALFRDGARVLRGSLRHALQRHFLGFAGRFLLLQRRVELAFLASGAATQLADAALEGEHTPELAARIARIARDLLEASGAAVHLRSPTGLQKLGADGEACPEALAAAALQSGRVEWGERTAAVPLRVRDELVGTLSLCFARGRRDLRPLQPLLARAGAVLVAAEREARKDRFLSLAAHELKTPLTSIKGFSYSLARRLERGETCDPRHVQVLEREAERLHALLEEMLEVSRIETGRFVLHQEPCELAELVEAAHRSLRRLGMETALETQVEAALPLIADRERIERALTALVLRARALGGPVRVEAERRDGEAHLRISWAGAALPDPERLAAFEPRWEVPQTQRQGLGMALFIAREVADQHGGRLSAHERSFLLALPSPISASSLTI